MTNIFPINEATSLLNMAREYHGAADALLSLGAQRPKICGHASFENPVRFLYLHTIELVLKAFLRSHDPPTAKPRWKTHDIIALYERCRSFGLVIDGDNAPLPKYYAPPPTIANVLRWLQDGNSQQGYRYGFRSRVTADLAWTRKVVTALMETVTSRVEARGSEAKGLSTDEREHITLTLVFPGTLSKIGDPPRT